MEWSFIKRLQNMAPVATAFVVVVLFALVAVIDKVTGAELSFSLFYLLPVALVSLRWRGATGQITAVVAALAWLSIDLWSAGTYSNSLIPFWNATVRFGFFSLFAYLMSRLQEALEHQTSLALTDPLTGLPNRRSFEEIARRELARADRQRSPLAMAIVDLDNFKLINDQHGHAAGDLTLRRFAAVAGRVLRAVDVAARVGGDEFALLLPDVDAESAVLAVERLQTALLDDKNGPTGCSIGIVLIEGGSVEIALSYADQALYSAKASGKGAIGLVEVPGKSPAAQHCATP